MNRLQEIGFFADLKWRERQSEGAIKKYQLRRLRKILGAATRITAYNHALTEANINPATAERHLLDQIAPMDKPALRQLVADNTGNHTHAGFHYWNTSGSTGFPLKIPRSPREARFSTLMNTYLRFRSGVHWYERTAKIGKLERPDKLSTWPQKLGFGRIELIEMRQDGTQIMEQLVATDPHAISTYASELHVLGQVFREQKKSIASLRHIISSGENLEPETRTLLKETFGVPVRNTYANVECGPIAYQCNHGTQHVVPGAVLIDVENIDSDGVGDAILTSLTQEAFPVIRYRIGDRMKISEGRCACGVYSQQIDTLIGKDNAFMVLPSGRRVSARSITRLAGTPGLLAYQVIQKAPDRLQVLIQKTDAFDDASETLVRHHVESGCCGEQVRIDLKPVGAVPRLPNGKLQSFISEIDRDAIDAYPPA